MLGKFIAALKAALTKLVAVSKVVWEHGRAVTKVVYEWVAKTVGDHLEERAAAHAAAKAEATRKTEQKAERKHELKVAKVSAPRRSAPVLNLFGRGGSAPAEQAAPPRPAAERVRQAVDRHGIGTLLEG
ncbi:hypothetical protein ROTAS13_04217 [Roseomonas sp. TAS13]|uniref:hypothetical protein n=1 Tax=Roseomonas sp. TAS13 TaxID=1926319 RepID=UPI00095B1B25|nr:hypothetical protein [Roseomonas sp. TAS13]GAV36529.1 hypothetical protein ROTAS13_04217 [Roseomonas sp. TAS13]